MIPQGWLPLAVGFVITAIVLAWEDFRMRTLNPSSFVPAVIGILWFYSGALSLNLLVPVFGVLGAVLLTSYIVLWVFSAKVGRGDYLTIALFAFWPWMLVLSIVPALVLGILGTGPHFKGKRVFPEIWNRGLRAIPLAGLMGLFALLYLGAQMI